MLGNPTVRAWVYIIAAVATFTVFVLGVLGVVTKESLMQGMTLAVMFVDGLIMLVAKANVRT